ncbi:MAG: sensor histidine kinase [Dehalococcoidia bacterium]
MNNLLSVIVSSAEVLLEEWSDSSTKAEVELIKKAGIDAAQVVRRLQQQRISVPQSGKQLVDMNGVVLDALQFVAPYQKELVAVKGVPIEIACELGEVTPVAGNDADLRTALVNVLVNALDALSREGGSISVETKTEGKFVTIAVRDTGPGMSEEVKQDIFNPFFTTKGVGRSGIGLFIVHKIVRRSGGRTTVDSALGEGSTITIELPAYRRLEAS